jgi:nitroreductase
VVELTADELLCTTRAVRKRLDFDRPVPRQLVIECINIAMQAPSASNRQHRHFVLVTDPDAKSAISELYRSAWLASNLRRRNDYPPEDPRARGLSRLVDSAHYLADNLHKVPVLMFACVEGRIEGGSGAAVAAQYASIYPAVWNFMLAARKRGLGTVLTTVHLAYEEECAQILGIPYEQVTQAAMVPIAFYLGHDFRPAERVPVDSIVHWGKW